MFLSLNPKHRERRVGRKPLELGISLPSGSVPNSLPCRLRGRLVGMQKSTLHLVHVCVVKWEVGELGFFSSSEGQRLALKAPEAAGGSLPPPQARARSSTRGRHGAGLFPEDGLLLSQGSGSIQGARGPWCCRTQLLLEAEGTDGPPGGGWAGTEVLARKGLLQAECAELFPEAESARPAVLLTSMPGWARLVPGESRLGPGRPWKETTITGAVWVPAAETGLRTVLSRRDEQLQGLRPASRSTAAICRPVIPSAAVSPGQHGLPEQWFCASGCS